MHAPFGQARSSLNASGLAADRLDVPAGLSSRRYRHPPPMVTIGAAPRARARVEVCQRSSAAEGVMSISRAPQSGVTTFAADMAREWTDRASEFRRFGSGQLADTTLALAAELVARAADYSEEPLDLAAASRESGYTRSHLARLVRAGRIPNVGRRGQPQIRRRDLPTKPGLAPSSPVVQLHGSSRQQVARSLIRKRG